MKSVLLTGASTGLGLAISKFLLDKPYHLILTSRAASVSRFEEAGIQPRDTLWIRTMDVTSAKEREAVIQEAEQELDGVDILINNAGVSYRSVVEHVTDEERQIQMEINYRAPMELVRLTLPSMRRKREGRIINVSSVGGMMAMPTMAVYSASKFALEGATEALYYEVKPWRIKVSLVQPGFIHSSSFQNVRYTAMSRHSQIDKNDPYYHHYENMTPFIEKMMDTTLATPEKVAKKIFKVMTMKNPPLRVSGTIDAQIFGALRRVLPRSVYHWVLYRSLPDVKNWGDTP